MRSDWEMPRWWTLRTMVVVLWGVFGGLVVGGWLVDFVVVEGDGSSFCF